MHRVPLYLAVALLLGATATAAQAKPKLLTYDALKPKEKIQGPSRVQDGETVILRIINVNTIREKYDLKISKTSFHTTTLPDELKTIVNLSPPEFAAQSKVSFDPNLIPDTLMAPFKALYDATKEWRKHAYIDSRLVNHLELAQKIRKKIRSGSTNVEIRKSVSRELTAYFDECGTFDAVRKIESLFREDSTKPDKSTRPVMPETPVGEEPDYGYKDYDKEKTDQAKVAFERVDEPVDSEKKRLDVAFQTLMMVAETWDQTYEKFLFDPKNKELVARAREANTAAGNLMSEAESEHTKLVEKLDGIRANLRIAAEAADYAFDQSRFPRYLELEDKVKKADEINVQVVTQIFPEDHVADSAEAAGGTGEVKAPPAPLPHNPSASRPESKTIQVDGRWVVDYGFGLAATTLRERNYYVKTTKVGDKERKRVREGVGDKLDVGPAVMAHIYPTTPSGIQFGPAFGIVPQDEPRYLIGAGLNIGRKTRFSLMGGFAFGKVQKLNGERIGGKPRGDSPSTVSVFDSGAFISGVFTLTF